MTSTPATSEPACGNCQKSQTDHPIPLKRCAKCQNQYYCSRECQREDWKAHKPLCRSSDSSTATIAPSGSGPCFKIKPFTAIEEGTWLKDRPEQDVFKLLTDVYRMRRADLDKFGGKSRSGNINAGAPKEKVKEGFEKFLATVKPKDDERAPVKKLLPAWWSDEKAAECVQFAEGGEFSNIYKKVDKEGIQSHYKEDKMPMQLRMFSEELDGTLVGGMSGRQMRSMLVAGEGGRAPGHMAHMSLGGPR
ncbi:hypothetical protein PMZ80_001976 [Knufia obscura]|uniref:MYND-type domain-containing protein n=1 Tax=Knufia obscura TaxID=1635080 RepID=A0ABR0RVY9_9EURO|nr:hypothetical protein PMZ80_001976 [Knufia obscura]